MNIRYKPLCRELLYRDMRTIDLMKLDNFSPNKERESSLKNLVKICEVLHCKLDGVIEWKERVCRWGQE